MASTSPLFHRGILCAAISGVDLHLRSLAVQHIVNGACQNPALYDLQRTGCVCLGGLENTIRGDIRIDNHMKVVVLTWRAANHHPFCAQSSTMASRTARLSLIPAQLEIGFDHRFANMLLQTVAIANVAVRIPAAVTRRVRPVSRMSAGRALFR